MNPMAHVSLTTLLLGFLLALLLAAGPVPSADRSTGVLGRQANGQSNGQANGRSNGRSKGQSNGFSDYAVAW